MSVIDEIAAERKRQIEAEGFTSTHDQEHNHYELALAAACYAMHAVDGRYAVSGIGAYEAFPAPPNWPWSLKWWKPKNPRRDLIRAAALIVAEIERLDANRADEEEAPR